MVELHKRIELTASGAPSAAQNQRRPDPAVRKEPLLLEHKGNPILLLGGTDDDSLFQWERLASYLHLAAERDVIVQIELYYYPEKRCFFDNIFSKQACR